jgi:ectoine hydroxylase-related dioxygenase (phytanoyl-CoA dioxygenase family)
MRQQFDEEGYLIIRGFQDPEFIKTVSETTSKLLEKQHNFFDTVGIDWREKPYPDLIFNEKIISLLKELNFTSPKFSGATFVNKKPFEPERPWHQDWWGWTLVYPEPPQIGILYYMTKTTIQNGCLRVLPKSHNTAHIIHNNYTDSNYTLRHYTKEIAVELDVGDIVVIDTRILHATHANKTSENRMGINVWYIPEFELMSEELKAHLAQISIPCQELGGLIPMHKNPCKIKLRHEDYLPNLKKLRRNLLFQ